LPPSRLQPLPFPEPARLTDLLEHEPSLLEEGLSVVARDLPFPSVGPDSALELLTADGQGRVTAISVAVELTVQKIEETLEIRSWIERNIGTLAAIAPSLKGCSGPARCLLLAGDLSPGARRLLAFLAEPRPEVFRVDLFDSPSGPAICLRPAIPAGKGVTGASFSRDAQRTETPGPPQEERGTDPLVGMPLSAEEAAEFRRLAVPQEVRPAAVERHGRAAPLEPVGRAMIVEN
jgi:hypothetical protein